MQYGTYSCCDVNDRVGRFFKGATAWCAGVPKVDATSFQIGSPEYELLRRLELAGFPEPLEIEPVAGTRLGGCEVRWQEVLRQRDERRPAANGAGYRLMHRVSGACAGAGGCGVCEPLWDGGIWSRGRLWALDKCNDPYV